MEETAAHPRRCGGSGEREREREECKLMGKKQNKGETRGAERCGPESASTKAPHMMQVSNKTDSSSMLVGVGKEERARGQKPKRKG